ncbi:conserved hypothetical protein [Crocosphaera subtropica ATCC 51142]|uniref:Uncharacterized protein n=1 Tax=Crocosphaera subtropica (strain ATCC 51142 / BH68) TaxID=43989 RepID=B1X1L7_CROS5|nr:hypothetical protein [Crocosphaera subtropica]ACB53047.1 conserved hypothetical protein [Crocosphaera subtropica ATCC 51142]
MLLTYIDKFGDWNPQLLRELKGRFKLRNLSIAAIIAISIQSLLLLSFSGQLPIDPNTIDTPPFQYSRYCTATPPENSYAPYNQLYCIKDLVGNWVINWQLWWLDIFKVLSVTGLFILLVSGTYLLITDLSKEENKGTLNFIRLTPRSSNNILLGKMLGVPSIIYFLCLLLFPLHLIAGFQAHISPSLMLAYYAGIIISCGFFYSLSLFFALVSSKLGGFQSFLGSGLVLMFLFMTTSVVLSSHDFISHTPLDWLILFYPGTILAYLVESTYIPVKTAELDYETLHQFAWYGKQFWQNSFLGISFILANYCLWTYWIQQALNRPFRNPNATWISKLNSYGISASFIILATGFVFQSGRRGRFEYHIFDNFIVLQMFMITFACLLMIALSPHRQTLYDWARYRHQTPENCRSLLRDLMLGEKSPSTLTIALNLGIIFAYLIPTVLIAPLDNSFSILIGFFVSLNILIIYALLSQRILLFKLPKPTLIATVILGVLVVVPPVVFAILQLTPHEIATPWLFTIFSLAAFNHHLETLTLMSVIFPLLSQWGLIALGSYEMSKHLQKAGESETKSLLMNN